MKDLGYMTIFAVVVLVSVYAIYYHKEKQWKKRNTYKVIAFEGTVPAYELPRPKSAKPDWYYLPQELIVISETETFYRVEGAVTGWIRVEDLEELSDGRYTPMSQYGVLLVDDEGEPTGAYIPASYNIKPVDKITFGHDKGAALWIDMGYLTKVNPSNKK